MVIAAVASLAVMWRCGPACPEEFTPGALIPTGDYSEVLSQGPGVMYTLVGSGRESPNSANTVMLVHVLVFGPAVEVQGSGVSLKTDCLKSTSSLTWKVGGHERTFSMSFDGKARTVVIGGQTYAAGASNCFVVELDGDWKASVIQVPLLDRDHQGVAVLAELRQALPGNVKVSRALTYTEAKATPRPGA